MKKIFVLISGIISLLLFIYFVSNFNSFTIYLFEGQNNQFYINGNITISKKINVLNINNVKYKGSDKIIKKIDISLINLTDGNETIIFKVGQGEDDLFSLNEYLDSFSYYYSELYGYEDSLKSIFSKNFYDNTKLKISITDDNNVETKYEIKINGQKYSNDKLIYKKVQKIS